MIERGEGWELRLGDCIEGMRTLADDSVDVVIADPPYEAEAHTKGMRIKPSDWRTIESSGGFSVRNAPLPFAALTEHQRASSSNEVARVSRRWVLVFCQVEASQHWAGSLAAAGLDYVRTMVWIKPDAQPQYTGDRPGVGYESIVVAHRPGKKRWSGGGRVGVFSANRERGPVVAGNFQGAPHPTTKPLPLMRELVSLFSDPDELILDPFAGSGSTGVACRQLGRRFIGWELNRDYFDIACRRLRGEEAKPNPAQPSLFGGVR